jgi:hypothetical protein
MGKGMHKCDNCNEGFTNKKTLVKHNREAHPLKKEPKPKNPHNLRFCPVEGCAWKSSTGGFSYHTKKHHNRILQFQKKEYLKGAKRVCVLCPKTVMGYNSYSHHLATIHQIKISAKRKLDQAQFNEETLLRAKGFYETFLLENNDA